MRKRAWTCAFIVAAALAGGTVTASAAAGVKPDAVIRTPGETSPVGNGVYNATGAGQVIERRIGETVRATFYVEVQNDGGTRGNIRVSGSDHNARFSVRYAVGPNDVTKQVKAGTLVLPDVSSGEPRTVTIEVASRRPVPKGTDFTVRLIARGPSGTVDVTKALILRPLYSEDQEKVAEQINASRARNGRSGLRMHPTLAAKAQAWSRHLADIGGLVHSNLASGVPSNWQALAENVGYHTNLGAMHQAFLASPDHRANMMGSYNYLGTGVTWRGGRVYVVHVFMRA